MIKSKTSRIIAKFFALIFTVFFTLFFTLGALTSCDGLTKKLWTIGDYEEEFRHFLINDRFGYIVFVTQKYHYVFVDNSNAMKNILSWPDRRILYIDTAQTKLRIDKNNNVDGEVMIRSFSQNLMPHREGFLFNRGFRKDDQGWFLSLKLSGKRYRADPNLKGYLPQLDLSYKIKVSTDLKKGEIIAVTALTPLTITADGVIRVGKILLTPFKN